MNSAVSFSAILYLMTGELKHSGYLTINEKECDGVQRDYHTVYTDLGRPTKHPSHFAFCRPVCNNHRSHGWEKIKPRKLGRQQH